MKLLLGRLLTLHMRQDEHLGDRRPREFLWRLNEFSDSVAENALIIKK